MARKKRVEKQNNKHRHDAQPSFNRGIVPLRQKTIPTILPRNVAQEDYLYRLADPSKNICFAIGPAGTGKTLLCTLMGVKAFMEREVKKIVITRPAVSVDEQHGFLPGDLNEKMAPWTRPIFDVMEEYWSPSTIEHMINENIIEIAPLAYMRGRTFKNSWIIADEMQNATPSQMKMLLTRIGENSKIIVTGDLAQHDRGFEDNGLKNFVHLLEQKGSKIIGVVSFTKGDVERHAAVTEVLTIYGDEE